jgi:hypothetical protein
VTIPEQSIAGLLLCPSAAATLYVGPLVAGAEQGL